QAQMPAGHIGRRAGGSTCPYAYSRTLYTSRKVTTAPLQRLACRYGRPSVQHHGARIESGALWNPLEWVFGYLMSSRRGRSTAVWFLGSRDYPRPRRSPGPSDSSLARRPPDPRSTRWHAVSRLDP